MRNIVFSTVAAVLVLVFFSSCTTYVRTPSGRTTAVGVRTQ
jgi:uncharacterized membrane protein